MTNKVTWIDVGDICIVHDLLIRETFDPNAPDDAALMRKIERRFDPAKPLTVAVWEGQLGLVHGYRRYAAAMDLTARGKFHGRVPCVYASSDFRAITRIHLLEIGGQYDPLTYVPE